MLYTIKLLSKEIKAPTNKEAYMIGTRIALEMKSKTPDILWDMIKKDSEELKIVVLNIYMIFDSNKTKEIHCNACKEFHKSFFINQEYNCHTCKLNAYSNRIKSELKTKKYYYKKKLEGEF